MSPWEDFRRSEQKKRRKPQVRRLKATFTDLQQLERSFVKMLSILDQRLASLRDRIEECSKHLDD